MRHDLAIQLFRIDQRHLGLRYRYFLPESEMNSKPKQPAGIGSGEPDHPFAVTTESQVPVRIHHHTLTSATSCLP